MFAILDVIGICGLWS